MTMIGFCGSPRVFVTVLRSPLSKGKHYYPGRGMMGDKMCAPKAIEIHCTALASSRHSVWLEPAPHILRKRRLAAENLRFWEHTGLGNLPAYCYGQVTHFFEPHLGVGTALSHGLIWSSRQQV